MRHRLLGSVAMVAAALVTPGTGLARPQANAAADAATRDAAAAAEPRPQPTRAIEIRRLPAEEAHQGVATDAHRIYAIANAAIGAYDRKTGRRIAQWHGDPRLFRHMNSCIVRTARLVCAASNYPDVPQASSIEWFDTHTLAHVATRSLGPGRGSLTWLDWHDGSWWAAFANYDDASSGGRGGEPGRDHRLTTLVRFDAAFAEQGAWLFPPEVLDRFAPRSSSGGAWGKDGFLYVTGHDRPEMYVLKLPEAGSILELVATVAIPTNGQAIAWDAIEPRVLWSLERATKELVASRVPPVTSTHAAPLP